MPLIPFYIVAPQLAIDETRVIHLLVPHGEIPPGDYELAEFYCPDPDCDCRRVMINVVEEKNVNRFLASISYGFDRDAEMAGPFLDALNPQSKYAEALLDLVSRLVLSDRRYLARLERHYEMTKRTASDPKHPAYNKLQKAVADETTPSHTWTQTTTETAKTKTAPQTPQAPSSLSTRELGILCKN